MTMTASQLENVRRKGRGCLWGILVLGLLFGANCLKLSLDEGLVSAASDGRVEDVQRLLDWGANPNFAFDGSEFSTPLTFAAANRHYRSAELLLQRGANPNCKVENGVDDWAGITLLEFARKQQDDRLVALLQRYGAK